MKWLWKEQPIELDTPVSGADSNVQVGNLTEISPTVQVESSLKLPHMDQKRRSRSTKLTALTTRF